MAMPQFHRSKCKLCGEKGTPDAPISGQGYCLAHGLERMNANNVQISEHHGPFFQKWRERMAASVGAVLLDEARARE